MWAIETTDTFDAWFDALDDTDRANMLASIIALRERGPMLPKPYADTVNGSCHSNMKELRVQSKGDPPSILCVRPQAERNFALRR